MGQMTYNLQRLDLAHVYRTAQARTEMRARRIPRDGEVEGFEWVITDDEADSAVVNQHILTGAALIANVHGGFRFVKTDTEGNPVLDASGAPVHEDLSGIDALTRSGMRDQFRLAFYNLPNTAPDVGSYRSVLAELIHKALVEYVLWQWYKDLGDNPGMYEAAFREAVEQIRTHAGKAKILKRKPSVW